MKNQSRNLNLTRQMAVHIPTNPIGIENPNNISDILINCLVIIIQKNVVQI